MRNLLQEWFPKRTHSRTGRPLNVSVEEWFDPANPAGWWATYHPEHHKAHLARLKRQAEGLPEPQDPWGPEDRRDTLGTRQRAYEPRR